MKFSKPFAHESGLLTCSAGSPLPHHPGKVQILNPPGHGQQSNARVLGMLKLRIGWRVSVASNVIFLSLVLLLVQSLKIGRISFMVAPRSGKV